VEINRPNPNSPGKTSMFCRNQQADSSHNKFYALRRDHFVGSRARVSAAKDRGQSTSGTLVLCFAASRSDHILTCCEDPASQNVSVKSTFSDIAAPFNLVGFHADTIAQLTTSACIRLFDPREEVISYLMLHLH
jgi:hypothetical protein